MGRQTKKKIKRVKKVLNPEVFLSWVIGGMLIVGCLAVGVLLGDKRQEEEVLISEGVPKLEIELSGVTLEEMKAGEKGISYGENRAFLDGEDLGEVEIKGRGNATWLNEKKPWQLNFGERMEILGITKAKKWVLLADVLDKSHLRNFMALSMAARMLGREFDYGGEMVEVYFDGEYEGLYYLVPKIELDKGSVDLRDKMGALVELDNLRVDGEYRVTDKGNYLYLKDAVAEKDAKLTEEAMEEFLESYNELEKAVAKGDFKRAAGLADLRSFAEYYLVNEFAMDPDAYFIGFHLYKDGALDKIHAGSVWDFDMGFANDKWEGGVSEDYYLTDKLMVKRGYEPMNELIYDLMEMEEFQGLVAEVFQDRLEGRGAEFFAMVRREAELIRGAVLRDGEKWGYDFQAAELETEFVIDWAAKRFEFLEEVYGENGDFSAGRGFL